ncbi:MAG TPA: Uma2 family endonuclease [Tepidisphaeraceae bacterium]|nr:Uma2 family endonuclease [Tepidisphaeraceae bacterium]
MTLAVEPKLMTIDEFLAMPDSVGYELIEGVLVERPTAGGGPMGALSDHVAVKIITHLNAFVEERSAGYVFGASSTYRCFGEPNTGRRADVSFIRRGRLPGERIPEGAIEIPADLAVEVVSPHDLAYEVEEKVALYLRHGFAEIWVIYPNTRTLHIHRKGEPILSLDAEQTLKGRDALEGFSVPVASFFPPTPAA